MTNAGNINSSWPPVRSIADRSSAGAEDGQILCKHRGIIRSAVEIIYARNDLIARLPSPSRLPPPSLSLSLSLSASSTSDLYI
jgi:hypothetical protein